MSSILLPFNTSPNGWDILQDYGIEVKPSLSLIDSQPYPQFVEVNLPKNWKLTYPDVSPSEVHSQRYRAYYPYPPYLSSEFSMDWKEQWLYDSLGTCKAKVYYKISEHYNPYHSRPIYKPSNSSLKRFNHSKTDNLIYSLLDTINTSFLSIIPHRFEPFISFFEEYPDVLAKVGLKDVIFDTIVDEFYLFLVKTKHQSIGVMARGIFYSLNGNDLFSITEPNIYYTLKFSNVILNQIDATPFLLDLFNQLLPHLISRYYSPPNPYYLNCSPDIISKALSDSI